MVVMTAPVRADDVVSGTRVSAAVLVREGPSTDTVILAWLRPEESAALASKVSGWYIVALADGTQGYVSKAQTVVLQEEGAEPLLVCRYPQFCKVISITVVMVWRLYDSRARPLAVA